MSRKPLAPLAPDCEKSGLWRKHLAKFFKPKMPKKLVFGDAEVSSNLRKWEKAQALLDRYERAEIEWFEVEKDFEDLKIPFDIEWEVSFRGTATVWASTRDEAEEKAELLRSDEIEFEVESAEEAR